MLNATSKQLLTHPPITVTQREDDQGHSYCVAIFPFRIAIGESVSCTMFGRGETVDKAFRMLARKLAKHIRRAEKEGMPELILIPMTSSKGEPAENLN